MERKPSKTHLIDHVIDLAGLVESDSADISPKTVFTEAIDNAIRETTPGKLCEVVIKITNAPH